MKIEKNNISYWLGDGSLSAQSFVKTFSSNCSKIIHNILVSSSIIIVMLVLSYSAFQNYANLLSLGHMKKQMDLYFELLIPKMAIEATPIKEIKEVPFYKIDARQFYKFENIQGVFLNMNLEDIAVHTKKEFEAMVLGTLRPFLRKRLKHLLPHTLDMAMKHKVDPFWVLAVMGTESHYNIHARSYVDAYGLMQIMPGTAHFLTKLLKIGRSYKHSMYLRNNCHTNIEMGVFYLNKLLKTFKGNSILATVAYNMGPNGVKRRIKRNLPVGVRNDYLDKVRKFYGILTSSYKQDIIVRKIEANPLTMTLVFN